MGLTGKYFAMKEVVDFVGLGAARCGTSWTANVLRAHPDICISEPKEVRYFNRYEMPVGSQRGKLNPNFDRNIDWYLRRFSHAKQGQILGEFSPVYLADMSSASRLHDELPAAKLIVCLRNPVDRAFSFYKSHRGIGLIPEISFEETLECEPAYVSTGMYAQQLRRFLKFFDRNQIHVLIFEDLISDPSGGFRKLFSFLEVDQNFTPNYGSFDTNESAKWRSKRIHKAAFKTSQWFIDNGFSGVLALLRSAGAHKLFNSLNAATAQLKELRLRPETRSRLTEIFSSDVADLESILGQQIIAWR